MCEKVNQIIEKAIDDQSKEALTTKDLISIAQELDLSVDQLPNALAKVDSQLEVLIIETSLEKVKESLIEANSFKTDGFSTLSENPQAIESQNLYLRAYHKLPAPLFTQPFYDICLKPNSNNQTILSWKLNLEKYQQSVFAYNAILSTVFLVLAYFGSYQFLPFLLISLGVIYWSRVQAPKAFQNQISEDLKSIKLSCELAEKTTKFIT